MLSFVTPSQLEGLRDKYNESRPQKRASAAVRRPTFLSHSSEDDALIPGIKLILENHGALVYTDDEDESLPDNPTPETAAILKSNIKRCPKFVVFVTQNGKNSKWIPWELGLADGIHSSSQVAIFPSAENQFDQNWSEREYLGLYHRIVFGDHDGYKEQIWMVIDHRTKAAIPLANWIKG
jgi:hypothetical protein